jgi:hypothetical protein
MSVQVQKAARTKLQTAHLLLLELAQRRLVAPKQPWHPMKLAARLLAPLVGTAVATAAAA